MAGKRFIWNDCYSVKVPSLDEQHKKFFAITNQILDLLDYPKKNSELKNSLILAVVELGRYAMHHLSYEEGCILKYNCDCKDHPLSHDYYREKVKGYLKKVRTEGTDIYALAEELAVFSREWLSNHIAQKDKEYVPCMEKNNVK